MSAWSPPRHPSGFYLSTGSEPTSIAIESDRINECMAYFEEHGLSRVSISRNYGFSGSDLDFLEGYPSIRGVAVSDASKIDIGGLQFLEDSLERLLIGESRQSLSLDRFKNLEEFYGDWHSRLGISSECRRLRILSLSKYKPKSKDLSELAELPALEDLSIIQSPLTSIRGVGRFCKLTRLELSYLSKLESIAGIEELKGGCLEILDSQKCKKISDHAAVRTVPSLRVVKFNDCGEIPTIDFLDELPNLEDFRFVNTTVLDGDLHPLLRLKSAGFFKKKHYSHTPEQVDEILVANAATSETRR